MTSNRFDGQDHAVTAIGSGPALLLAHGAGGGTEMNFGPVLPRLSAAHRTIGVDYPGSAGAPRVGPLSVDLLADRLLAAADAEGVDRFAVAGFSLGGPVAMRLAASHPDRVEALILTATFARADPRLRLAADIWSRLHATGDTHLLAKFLTLVALSDEGMAVAGSQGLEQAIDALADEIAPGTPEHTALVGQLDVRADARRLTMPTLVIVTRRDPLVPASLQRELHAMIPGAELSELDSGHMPMVERPEQWADQMLSFLDSVAEPQRATDHVVEVAA